MCMSCQRLQSSANKSYKLSSACVFKITVNYVLVQVVYMCIGLLQDWNLVFVSQSLAGSGNVSVCVLFSSFREKTWKIG